MHELPLPVRLPCTRIPGGAAVDALRAAARGAVNEAFVCPDWLLPHQRDAAVRLAGSLATFSGALLADAAGLGKTWVALALAAAFRDPVVVVPASLRTQWSRTAARAGVTIRIRSHEALSRGARLPHGDLIVVDEAHRFRNPGTRRYDALARGIGGAQVLLLSASPVVNGPADIVHLLRLFLPDNGLRALGLPSLTDAAAGPLDRLLHAVLPLVVARDATAARITAHLPATRDDTVRHDPPLTDALLERVIERVRALRFPPVPPATRALLQRHLLLRLASSPEALHGSLRRHLRYTDSAVRSLAAGGELPSRTRLLRWVEELDGQLELALHAEAHASLNTRTLEDEAGHLRDLLALTEQSDARPKTTALGALLASGSRHKTIVFTTAQATALALARAFGWRRVGVATARGGRIASGPIPVTELLRRFAPTAQGGGPVPAAMRIDVLLATDLASEGLNLQDADAVIHFDLPWNPLRLAQRAGRIARLGSPHAAVTIAWFAPPPPLDEVLRQREIIDRKARLQLALPVPVSGRVGAAGVTNAALAAREAFARAAPVVSGYAVWAGPAAAACVLRWTGLGGTLREICDLDGQPVPPALLAAHATATTADRPLARATRERATRLVRHRSRSASTSPEHPGSVARARRLLNAARAAGHHRDHTLLETLDAVLTRLRAGVSIGAERDLDDLLEQPEARGLARWLRRHRARDPGLVGPIVEVLVAGSDARV